MTNDDYAVATGAGRPVHLDGIEYRVGKLSPADLGDLQAWLKEQVPDPRILARDLCRDMPDAVAIRIWQDLHEESKDWPPSPLGGHGYRLLTMNREGAARVLWVLLREHNPGVDLERARAMAARIGYMELGSLFDMGFPEPSFDPKAPTNGEASP